MSETILDEGAVSEKTWKKGFPDLDGDYYCRVDEYDKNPTLIRIESRSSTVQASVYEFGCGDDLRREYEAEADYEYLGPLTPEDIPALCATVKHLRAENAEWATWHNKEVPPCGHHPCSSYDLRKHTDGPEAAHGCVGCEITDLQSQLEQLRSENERLHGRVLELETEIDTKRGYL